MTFFRDNCIFFNAKSVKTKKPKENFIAEVNGCGPKSIDLVDRILPNPGFTRCCDNHDRCYGRCNSSKASCDNSFLTCMRNTCSTVGCRLKAELFYNAVKVGACYFYLKGQNKACKCV